MPASSPLIRALKTILPTPFTIAVLLTLLTFLLALIFTESKTETNHLFELASYWNNGLWNNGLLVFAFQMMLILVLGHAIALSPVFEKVINGLLRYCTSTSSAAFIVSFVTLIVSFFNWGLGLVFGAIFARKVAEHAVKTKSKLHYGIVGAAGYSGLMIWHGGISGSAPIKVAEYGHLAGMMEQVKGFDVTRLPDRIGLDLTVYSQQNLLLFALLLVLVPTTLYMLGKRNTGEQVPVLERSVFTQEQNIEKAQGAEVLDRSNILGITIGLLILIYATAKAYHLPPEAGFLSPNNINLILLGLAITLHGNFRRLLVAIDNAIGGASGILIQFPLYFGIMGIMKESGLVTLMAESIVANASASTYPFLTFLSAGLVNIFVPSGGGQWAIQGPIIIQATQQLGLSLPQNIMAMAYGDQLTNMLQPFWALPLLGITGLKPKDIIPWSVIIMGVGFLVFGGALLLT